MIADLILGIDGGGSKTLVALADRTGKVLGLTRGGAINPLDQPRWQATLEAQLRPFASEARLAGVAAALPAYGEVEEISATQRDAIAAVFGNTARCVLNDVDAAHIGAFAGGSGILVLSGTGSMGWARDADGRSHRIGGWGDTIGDEGSSYWMGRRILSVVSQSLDGRSGPTVLVAAVFAQLGIDPAEPMNGLEGWVAGLAHARSGIAALAPLATRLAEAGDDAAAQIVEQAADELARHVTAIAARAGIPTEWSYAGGAFDSRFLRDAVAARIGRAPRAPRLPPIGGTLLAAAQHLGWQLNADWIDRLAASISTAPAKADERQPTN